MGSLIFKNIAIHKIQAVSIVLLIATGTMLMYALFLYSVGAHQGVVLAAKQSGADVMLVSKSTASEIDDSTLLFTGAPYHEYISADAVAEAASVDGVDRVSPQFFAETLAMPCCSLETQTRVIGVDFSTDWTLQGLTGYDLGMGLQEGEVLVGSGVAINPDDTITLHGIRYRVVDRFAQTGSDIDRCVVADIASVRSYAWNLHGYDHYWEEFGDPEDIVSVVLIDLDDSLSDDQQNVVVHFLEKIAGCRVIVRSKTMQEAEDSIRIFLNVMMFATAAILFVALVQLFSRFYSMAWDRRSEFSIYRMLGAKKRHLRLLVCGEVFALCGFSVSLGLVLGLFLYQASSRVLFAQTSIPFVEPTAPLMILVAVTVILLWLIMAMLSILMPLHQISKSEAALVMRQNDIV